MEGVHHPESGGMSFVAVSAGEEVLVHRDGHRVSFLEEGVDERGGYLMIEHVWTRSGVMAGPHWHPMLEESFHIREGRMRFVIDGMDLFLGPGEEAKVRPRQVHRFWNEGEGLLRVVHEVRPPGNHRQMFELWHRLDLAGKTTRHGIPKDPLELGLLWELQDGYVAGLPASLQSVVFGSLARLARFTGRADEPEGDRYIRSEARA